ncbi:thioredoxin family protein [Amycolatopsis sp. cmx-4-61]|uniref:thioredoxin family protein n=1 Tax=Amycolatopsis sp. cmx-4-61 TaxID=2790937 RepID=UPI00397B88EA
MFRSARHVAPQKSRTPARLLPLFVGATAGAVICGVALASPGSHEDQSESPNRLSLFDTGSVTATPSTVATTPAGPSSTTATPTTTHATTPAARPVQPASKAKKAQPPPPSAGPSLAGYDAGADSRAAVAVAKQRAVASGKKVLLDFGANWCGVCKRIDGLFGTASISKTLSSSYEVVKIEIGANMDMLRELSNEGSYRLPVLIVLGPDGGVLVDTAKVGLPETTEAGLGDFLRKWAA